MKLYDSNAKFKLKDMDTIKWLLLYWKGVKENSLLWKVIVVAASVIFSCVCVSVFKNELTFSQTFLYTAFSTLCSCVLFLPFRSLARSYHWDYRAYFIIAYLYCMFKRVKWIHMVALYENDSNINYWMIYCFFYVIIFGALLQGNLIIHKLYDKNNKIVVNLYKLMCKYSLFTRTKGRTERKLKFSLIVNTLLILVGAAFVMTSSYLDKYFPEMNIETVFFTVRFANGSYSTEARNRIILMAVFVIVLTVVYAVLFDKREKAETLVSISPDRKSSLEIDIRNSARSAKYCFPLLVFLSGTYLLSSSFELLTFIKNNISPTTIYEDYYVAPTRDVVHFPDKKKNLVYIYMESYENTYSSFEHGGNQPTDYMPEIYELEKNNINFSNTSDIGGQAVFFPMTMYTMGATVAQTSGVPLTSVLKMDHNSVAEQMSTMLGSLRRLEDVLHDEGYNQLFIRGENTDFAGYNKYVGRYENSKIYDVKNAAKDHVQNGIFSHPWGMEDKVLFPLVKEHIDELAEQDAPFCVTVYTVDTHTLEAGFRCELCDPEIENDFAASVRCSSKQVSELIEWLSEKPYWEDTVVILVGDHLSELELRGLRFSDDGYVRTTANCFINAAKEPVHEKKRTFCSMDMFPTTLSAIGCKIDGDRLGLGTDLFSDTPTLCEELGKKYFIGEVQKKSEYYDKNFIVQNEEN